MWVSLLLLTLGLNISQVRGQDNSTQMYYAKLLIDKSAVDFITKSLESFAINSNLTVGPLYKTTTCQNDTTSTECTCEPRYRWSDEVCSSTPDCCGTEKCSFPTNSPRMCISNTSVNVSGVLTLTGNDHEDCLSEMSSERYKKCNSELLKKMKAVYSTLQGFDIITIKEYRVGSIVVIFEMILANGVNSQVLTEKSQILTKSLGASLEMVTTGIVSLAMPPNPVYYYSQQKISCSIKEDLGTPELKLTRGKNEFEITNGTGASVEMESRATNLLLLNVTKLWAGSYSCVFHNTSDSFQVYHRAIAELDVCLLPTINVYTSPGFPLCSKDSDLKEVNIQCEMENSTENYVVTWNKKDIKAQIKQFDRFYDSSIAKVVYEARTVVSCNNTQTPEITCSFMNRCNQSRGATRPIVIIKAKDSYCKAENEWGNTKAGYTAVLRCNNGPGERKRPCSEAAVWGKETSACVNQEVSELLEQASIVDIGLGTLDGNTAQVFSVLQNVTVNSEKIKTYANMNGTVEVLTILSKKPKLSPNVSVTNDFLESSSNILDDSLSDVWTSSPEDIDNLSLAEKYLESVEKLVEMSNTSETSRKKNIEVRAHNCSNGSPCTNRVFNVTVKLKSADPGNVKTTGFQHLQEYLPNNNTEFDPNSIVVSTTAENKPNDLEIKIKFALLRPRPRNVQIQCVAWDNSSRAWSSDGCKWEGPSNEGECVCYHLSSFAILMSKKPLEIAGMQEVTYVALAVSIMSLAISIGIEVIVWSSVVKTNTLYLRHMTHINISICLLIADCCFLASSQPDHISPIWCQTTVVLKHFCFLCMFFWMFCLSVMLLHQATFPFHTVSKKNYLKFSVVLGYVCPLLIVVITFLTNKGGAEGIYYSKETCWLVYSGTMKGSIHTFVIPVGIIVFVNIFSMVVVIMKLLDRPDASQSKEKTAAMSILRSVVLLTPIFGVTWIFGFGLMLLDLTVGPVAYVFNYAFTVLNAFQGLFILLTTCLGDKLTREALLNRLQNRTSTLMTESTTASDPSLKK